MRNIPLCQGTTTNPDLDPAPDVQAPNYTQIPNTLFVLMSRMKEAEIRVVMAIARETFGWHRNEKELSLTRLCALTGLSRQGVLNGLESGRDRQLIERRAHRGSFIYRLLVNEADCREANEVDRFSKTIGPPSRPDRSTSLTGLVNFVDRSLVNEVDTANKERKKLSKKEKKESSAPPKKHADERSSHPAIQAVRDILSSYPNKMVWDDIIQLLGEHFDLERLKLCAKAWSRKTKNMHNLAWLFEWYTEGIPGRNGERNGNGHDQRYERFGKNESKGLPPGNRARGGPVEKPQPVVSRRS